MTSKDDELLLRYLDGILTSEENEALHELLRESAQARHRLRLHAAVSEGLPERRQGPTATPPPPLFAGWKRLAPWTIAAAATVFALATWWGGPKKEPIKVEKETFLALLVDEAGAEFAEGAAPDEVRLGRGDYQLNRGAVHLRFSNGADVVMKAPASFGIESAFRVRFHDGGMRAVVPPSARGFTVATPGADYEDLGTEFGLLVNGQSGASELHVFDGQVDVRNPDSQKRMSSIHEGQSVQFSGGALRPAKAPGPDRFLEPGSIGLLRWAIQRSDFGKDPNLIGFYPFVKNSDREGTLRNEAESGICGDGEIHGARWVSGRWPGKEALLFDRDTDFVELSVPGEFEELTFAAWMKLDRFDFSHNSIFDSNGWGRGDVHWQLNRSGIMWVAAFAEERNPIAPRQVIPTGQWIHVAGTISVPRLTSCVYLNGQLAGSHQISEKTVLTPGLGRIGNWLWDEDWPFVPIRALRGRIDEFAIWKRALTESEVGELVEEGKPAALWAMQSN